MYPFDENICKDYRSVSNKLNNMKQKLKKKYYGSISTSNIKKFWDSVNSVVFNKSKSVKQSLPDSIKNQNTLNTITEPDEIINYFNNFFCEIGPTLSSSLPQQSCQYSTEFLNRESQCFFYKTNSSEVIKIINNLKIDAASGHDSIPCKIFKFCHQEISCTIAEIINLCFTKGTFPDILKIAKISAIYKSGNKCDPTNYRPISVLFYLFYQKYSKKLYYRESNYF
jgi:hypothetical protein